MFAEDSELRINYRWPYSKNRESLKQDAIVVFAT